jgi:hypothetical protein
MPATPITAAVRYIHPGVSKMYFLTAIAAATTLQATRTELDAGTDLSPELRATSGWNVSSNIVDAPDAGSAFTSKVIGRTTAENSTATFYMTKTGADALRALLPRGTTGFVVFCWGGDVQNNLADTFPVTVASAAKSVDLAGEDPANVVVSFAITRTPAIDWALPALV